MTFLPAVFAVLAGALVAGAVGHAIARFFTGDVSKFEAVAWAFATGLLVQAMLFVVLLPIPGPVLTPLLAADAAIVATSFLVRRRFPSSRLPGEGPREGRATVTCLLLVAGTGWLLFLIAALSEPMWSTDYLAIWGLKAKTIALTDRVPARLFTDPALYWAHREYPLLVPLSLAALASFTGGWRDQALALFFPLCELATLAALYGFLARRVSSLAGAAAAALTALCFPLYRSANAGTAEVPFTLSLVLAATAFLDSLSDRSRAILIRLAVASLFCASIKQEGWIFVGLLGAALAIRRRWLPGAALALPAAAHWVLLYFLRGPQTRRDFDFTFFRTGRWGELASRFFHVVGRMAGTEALAAWLPLVSVTVYLLVTRRSLADTLLPILLLQIVCYAIAFSVSSFDPMWAAGVLGRLAMTLFPVLALVLAARLEESRRATVA
jgi:hypothetical protein